MNSEDKKRLLRQRENLLQTIEALEIQRSTLGDQVVETAQSAIREKLVQLGESEMPPHERQERKLITVLFADVSGFTAMAEAMDHEIVSTVINSLWSRVDRAIQNQGGRIDKHIGDAVMALFGTPTAREDDPERAIRAAIRIQQEVQKWQDEFNSSFYIFNSSPTIQLRIGINTGPALLGTVGTIGEYTAIGNTVNIANRLESAAPRGGILISHGTYQHVRGIFDVTVLDPINVKGQSKPIQVYTVHGIRPRTFRASTRGIEGIETRTIGREEELEKLESAFEQTAQLQQMHLVNIVAEAGTGKSRLLYEFSRWLDLQKHPVHLFKGRATLEMAQVPYALLRDLFAGRFEIEDQDRLATARRKLKRGIQSYLDDNENANLYTPFIGHLIGLDYSTNPHLRGILGDAQQIHNLAFHYMTQLFAEISRNRTAVIFLEDIHWADPGSLDFFRHLMDTRADLPILIVALTRSTLFEQQPDWGSGPVQCLRLDLLPLSEESCRRLVEEILQKVPVIPPELIDLIVEKAEGSPFYVEELIKVLIDKGVILRGEEQWRVELEPLSDLQVPATLTGLLQARLDSLSVNTRETLQQASVVGRIFWTQVVENMRNPENRLANISTPAISRLKELKTKELIFPYGDLTSPEIPEFIFKNAVLHNVTYESVLLRLRPVYHLQVAQGLIEISGERATEYAGRVGEHYEQAQELLQAADWYARAGKQAQDTYTPDAAIEYYQKALRFLEQKVISAHVPQQLEIYYQLGEVLNWKARYTDAADSYKKMLTIAKTHGDKIAQCHALQGLAASLSDQGDHRAALDTAILAESIAREVVASAEIAKALWAQGSARYRLGEPRSVLTLAEQALSISTELNDRNEMGRCLNLLGAAYYVLGEYRPAQTHWESALKIFKELGNRQQGMLLLSNLGVIADARGDYESAYKLYNSALEVAREIGNKAGEIYILSNRGIELVALKNFAAAEADLGQVIRMKGMTGSWFLANTYNYYAEALLGLERFEEATYAAQQGLAQSVEGGSAENIGGAWRVLGLIAGTTGKPISIWDRETGELVEYVTAACFDRSAKIFAEAEIHGERARTLREWARYELSRHNTAQGEQLWQEARTIFSKMGAKLEVDRMRKMPS